VRGLGLRHGGKHGDLEPGIVLKKLNEALTDHSGRARDAGWIFTILEGKPCLGADAGGGGRSQRLAGGRPGPRFLSMENHNFPSPIADNISPKAHNLEQWETAQRTHPSGRLRPW